MAEHRVERQRADELKVLQPQIDALEKGSPARTALTADDLKMIREVVDATLANISRERDQRVQRVLAKAQMREQRREKAYRAVQERSPMLPQGLVATIQQKGYQVVLAWQAAAKAAAKLVEQAKALGQRLLEASGAKQLMAWSQEMLRLQQPELVARRNELVQGRSPQKATKPELEPPERVPFWEQPGFDPKTFVGTRGRDARQTEPLAPASEPPPPKDIKTQAAEGVAAFRARREKERQAKLEQGPSEKSYGDKMLERFKAQVEAEQKAAEIERNRQREQTRGPSRGRSKGKDGPEMGD